MPSFRAWNESFEIKCLRAFRDANVTRQLWITRLCSLAGARVAGHHEIMPQSRKRPTKRAQDLRNNAPDAERRSWFHLRARQLGGSKFSRQMPVGLYVCDFLCRERGPVVELDGGQHAVQTLRDEARTAFLERQGLTVLRFWNNDVLQNTDGVLQVIIRKLEELPPRFERPPLPLAGGEEPRSGEEVGSSHAPTHIAPTPLPPPASGRGLW